MHLLMEWHDWCKNYHIFPPVYMDICWNIINEIKLLWRNWVESKCKPKNPKSKANKKPLQLLLKFGKFEGSCGGKVTLSLWFPCLFVRFSSHRMAPSFIDKPPSLPPSSNPLTSKHQRFDNLLSILSIQCQL